MISTYFEVLNINNKFYRVFFWGLKKDISQLNHQVLSKYFKVIKISF